MRHWDNFHTSTSEAIKHFNQHRVPISIMTYNVIQCVKFSFLGERRTVHNPLTAWHLEPVEAKVLGTRAFQASPKWDKPGLQFYISLKIVASIRVSILASVGFKQTFRYMGSCFIKNAVQNTAYPY